MQLCLTLILHIAAITEKNLGLTATVEIEGSTHHKLQVKSLLSTQHNSSLPAYAPFNSSNSEKLPAQFVLRLSQPLPMLNSSIDQIIQDVNEPPTIKDFLLKLVSNSKESIVSLIARQELDLNKGPFCRSADALSNESCDINKHVYTIKLLNQYHTYHILDNHLERKDAVYVTKIPFTHPTSIPIILKILRQQAMFNFIIGSCIRRSKDSNANPTNSIVQETENSASSQESMIFDITPVNSTNLCIAFEHPSRESLATLEIDLKELSCQLYALEKESVCSNEFASKVLQKCWSIPITLRAVLRKCQERRLALLEDANKRRERELQELLANNAAAAQQSKSISSQDMQILNNFGNLGEKSNTRDLNQITEFLSAKFSASQNTSTTTSDASNQTTALGNNDSDRTNFLKKVSCKPKVKQGSTTKNQAGSKILSLMLKRQNSSSTAAEDSNLKATLSKKAKVKQTDASTSKSTTKFVSQSDMSNAAKVTNKPGKLGNNITNQQNVSISLIRNSPIKSFTSTNSIGPVQMTVAGVANMGSPLTTGAGNTLQNRSKSQQPNGAIFGAKPRKTSINAVLDKLVGGVTPDQSLAMLVDNVDSRSIESPKSNTTSAKAKSRNAAESQFAIKQGGGLKLTVTKTKTANAITSSSTSDANAQISTSNQTNPVASSSGPAASLASSSAVASSGSNTASSKADASKILGLGSTAIKYTIPKIPKTSQASTQSTSSSSSSSSTSSSSTSTANATNSSDTPSGANESMPNLDDNSNNAHSTNVSLATNTQNSSQTKRPNATPFNRPNVNRNAVSSSTHPIARTSNPLASVTRTTSTSNNDNSNHFANRISSSNQGSRNQGPNRSANAQQQQSVGNNARASNAQGPPTQMIQAQSTPGPMFAIGLGHQPSPFQNGADINLLAASQVAMLNQQRALNSAINQLAAPVFMSSSIDANLISSSRQPQFAAALSQTVQANPAILSTNSITDSMQRPAPSIMSNAPQFYMRQPMYDESVSAVSSTPKSAEPSQSIDRTSVLAGLANQAAQFPSAPFQLRAEPLSGASAMTSGGVVGGGGNNSVNATALNLNNNINHNRPATQRVNQGVSSSSDPGKNDTGPSSISTPSSPTECAQVDTVDPPPLIPIDSLDDARQIQSPDQDHPDDESDRLSIVDTNDNIVDGNSLANTPKPSSAASPAHAPDGDVAAPATSSKDGVVGSQSESHSSGADNASTSNAVAPTQPSEQDSQSTASSTGAPENLTSSATSPSSVTQSLASSLREAGADNQFAAATVHRVVPSSSSSSSVETSTMSSSDDPVAAQSSSVAVISND